MVVQDQQAQRFVAEHDRHEADGPDAGTAVDGPELRRCSLEALVENPDITFAQCGHAGRPGFGWDGPDELEDL